MIRKKKDNVEWLEFELLKEYPELIHGIFLRKGGFSQAPFHSLNVSQGMGDDSAIVAQNKEKIFSLLNISKVFSPRLCHGSDIEIVQSQTKPNHSFDGVVTKTTNLGLFITHADCQAALFYDPIRKIIANIHCGWRGNVQNIYAKTVLFFQERFGSDPKDLIVCISPSLGPDKAEFVNYKTELPESFLKFQVRPNYFDFWEISKAQLMAANVCKEHIEIAKICTYQNENDFFSYRREKKTGRNGTLIALRNI